MPTIEMTHARTIFTRFEDDLRAGGSGVDPSSGDRVAVGIESVLVLLVRPVSRIVVRDHWMGSMTRLSAGDLRIGSNTRPLTCP